MKEIISAIAFRGKLLSDSKTIYKRKLLIEHYLDPTVLDGMKKIVCFNSKKLNYYEKYKLRRLNPLVALDLTRIILKPINSKKTWKIYFFSFIYTFLIIYLRNLYLSIYEILSIF